MPLELNGSLASTLDGTFISVISGGLYRFVGLKWKTFEMCISQMTSVFFTLLTALLRYNLHSVTFTYFGAQFSDF